MVFRLYCVIYRGNKIDHLPYVPLELKCEILKPGYVPQREFVQFKMFHLKKVSVAIISRMESSNFGKAVLIFMHRLCSKVLPVELRIFYII